MKFMRNHNDLTKVFDQNWKANHNYSEKKEFFEKREKHFNQMYGIKDTYNEHKKEILYANSVEGKTKNLAEKMNAAKGNMFRNGFK